MKNRFCFLFSGALSLGLFSCSSSTGPTAPDSAEGAAFESLGVQTTVVDGRTYSYRSGGSGPKVVFEAGLGDDKDVWFQVLPEVARFSDVFAYDRAGYGGSDPGPRPRDGARMVDELRQVLQSTGRRPPYVLVGHSLGGTLMELYARTHPSEVAGLVLVDSRSAELSARCVEEGLTCSSTDFELDGLPEPNRSEAAALTETEKQVRAAGPPAAMPTIVLAHGQPGGTPEYETLWRSSQEDLAATVPGAQLIIAEMSGHYIQLDEPHLVIEAVRSVIQSSR